MATILCIDDETAIGVMLERSLDQIGHKAVLAHSVDEGLKAISRQPFDLIISDYRMPNASGSDFLESMNAQGIETPVIMMTAHSSLEHAVLSMRHGAVDYLTKPIRAEALRLAVNNAIEVSRLKRQNLEYRRQLDSLKGVRGIVGESRALKAVLDTIARVAPTRATVLLEGESGTGKELFARALHEQSPRLDQPFVTLNCAAVPEGLVESSLFGHERGAFTGATQRTQGAFERAHNGTLLLDEISEMHRDLQPKLLRAIQEQEFERVGGHTPIKVDVRLVATTNRNLRGEIKAGRFREDLFHRLSVVPVRTPPLRERPEDIPALVKHFIEQTASQVGVKVPAVRTDVLEMLQARQWAGNIRELRNAVERAVILCRSGMLKPGDFEGDAGGPAAAPVNAVAAVFGRSQGSNESFDLDVLARRTIECALQATGGHRTKAARLLGISERTLRNKLNVKPAPRRTPASLG